jgi:uncharacterized protein (TIGR02996 family)
MNDDEAFVQAIAVNPNDDTLRLVYADWLEERGDLRGEYLRLDCLLDSLPAPPRSQRQRLEDRLADITGVVSSEWLEKVGRKIDIILHSYKRDWKINVIKVIREVTGLGLKEIIYLVHALTTNPAVVVMQVRSKREARRIKHTMKMSGAVVSAVPEVD